MFISPNESLFIKPAIEKISFDGWIYAIVVAHDPDSARIGVHIPKIMPFVSLSEKGGKASTYYTSPRVKPVNSSILGNKNKFTHASSIKLVDYFWVSSMEFLREEWHTHDDIHHQSDFASSHGHAHTIDNPYPHPGVKRTNAKTRRMECYEYSVYDGERAFYMDRPRHCFPESLEEKTCNCPSPTQTSELCDVDKLCHPKPGEELESAKRQLGDRHFVDLDLRIRRPQVHEEVLVFFLDGDPKKGYYLFYAPPLAGTEGVSQTSGLNGYPGCAGLTLDGKGCGKCSECINL